MEEGDDGEEENGEDKKKKKPKVVWSREEMKNPTWWPRMLWQERGVILFITLVFIALVLLGTLVDGWNDFIWEAWYSVAITVLVFLVLVRMSWINTALVMVIAVTFLLALEIITPKEAVEGFGSTTVITIAVLFVVAMGIEKSGCLGIGTRYLLYGATTAIGSQARLMISVSCVSSFINNTPIVAMMMPIVEDFCRNSGIPPSKLMIPLSWSAILGGTVTLIGTSTNLIVLALIQKTDKEFDLSLFEMTPVGAPVCVIGVVYILLLSHWLLPVRTSP